MRSLSLPVSNPLKLALPLKRGELVLVPLFLGVAALKELGGFRGG
jgi:hypothetical protein